MGIKLYIWISNYFIVLFALNYYILHIIIIYFLIDQFYFFLIKLKILFFN